MNRFKYLVTLLVSFSRLDGIIDQMEWTVYNRALATHGFGGHFPMSTFGQVAELIKVIERKNELAELKHAIVKALNKMDREDRVLLLKRFVKGRSAAEIASVLGLAKGAFYYRIECTLEQFGKYLAELGFDQKWFDANCDGKLWFRKVFAVEKDDRRSKKHAAIRRNAA